MSMIVILSAKVSQRNGRLENTEDMNTYGLSLFKRNHAMKSKNKYPRTSKVVVNNSLHLQLPRKSINIIIILVDDMGYSDVGFHGGNINITQNITSIAKYGIRFTNAYVTAPQCSPSRASLLTGLYQQRFGHETNDEFLSCLSNRTVRIIPEYLKPLGYDTGFFGKWNLGDRPNHPKQHGFDSSYGYFDYEDESKANVQFQWRGMNVSGRSYATSVIMGKAIEFISSHQHKRRPFFLYLAPMTPHPPLLFPPSYNDVFEKAVGSIGRRKSLAMIAELDDCVGAVLNALKSLTGQTSAVFFINDNGGASSTADYLNLPLRGFKGEVYEGGVRVSMAMQYIPALEVGGIVSHQPVSTLDILPTVLDLAEEGAEERRGDGQSLVPLLDVAFRRSDVAADLHHQSTVSRTLYWRFWMKGKEPKRAVRDGDWKWVRLGIDHDQLFNLSADIGEHRDVAAARPDVVRDIRQKYFLWERSLPLLNRSSPLK